MEVLFNPRVVAVVGASHDPHKVGHVLFYNLLRTFRGRVYPVNIRGGEILERKVYRSLRELPEAPDLVFVAVPARFVPSIAKDAVEVGAKGIVVISGGFGEVGNKDLDEALMRSLEGTGTYLVGPNCIGIYTPHMNGTFLSPDRMDFPGDGDVSVVSQSGALIASLLDTFAREGIGVSKVVSLGNKLLLDETDFLEYLGNDPDTRIIVMYLEDVRRGRKFFNALKTVAKEKPVIVLKGGKTERGMKAASSHTEAMVGDYRVFRGMLRQAGAIEVSSMGEALDVILALRQPLPKGKRALIVTNGGGFGVIASDYLSSHGFELPPWRKQLNLPPHIVQSNPFDLTGDATPEMYFEVIEEASADYDFAIAIIVPQTALMDTSIARLLGNTSIPVYAFVPGGSYGEIIRSKLIEVGVPAYERLEDLLRAVTKVVDYSTRIS